MGRRRASKKGSGKGDDREATGRAGSIRPGLERRINRAYSLMARDRYEEAYSWLDQAPEAMKGTGPHALASGEALLAMGHLERAAGAFEKAQRLMPRSPDIELLLGRVYADLGLNALAWKELMRYLRSGREDAEGRWMAEALSVAVARGLRLDAEECGLPLAAFTSVSLLAERAQRLMGAGRFASAIRAFDKAIGAAPSWPRPRNNRALCLFLDGQPRRAIRESEQVIAELDPENTHALSNLVQFHVCMGEQESAETYAERLRAKVGHERVHIQKLVEGLAFIGDGDALWSIAQTALEDELVADALDEPSFYALAAAAANRGGRKAARTLYARALGGPLHEQAEHALQALKAAKGRGRIPGPSLKGEFRYVHYLKYVPQAAWDGLQGLVDRQDTLGPSALQKEAEALAARFPGLITLGVNLIWGGAEAETGVEILATLATPRAHAELRRFSASKYGSLHTRTYALHRLEASGGIEPGESLQLWDETTEEWRQISPLGWELFPEPPASNPQVAEQLDAARAARREGEFDREEALLKQAWELDPTQPEIAREIAMAAFNSRRMQDGEAWLRRSLEVDPEFHLGRAYLASYLAFEGRLEEANRELEYLEDQQRMPFAAAAIYFKANIEVAIHERNLEAAESFLAILQDTFPDLSWSEEMQEQVDNLRFHLRWLRDVHNYHLRARKKPIRPDERLEACLARISRDALSPTARAWGCRTSGRKAELIERLAVAMNGPEAMRRRVRSLPEEQRQALLFVLERGGSCSWDEFTEAFGDDFDDSPYWQYHDPETTPGRLRMLGLLSVGTHKDETLAVIPYELRDLLTHAMG